MSVEFVVDIATKLRGADSLDAALSGIGDRLLSVGSSAAQLDEVLKRTSSAVEEAAAASKASADALAAGDASYKATEASADRAAKAVEAAGARIIAQRAKLEKAITSGDEKGFWKAVGGLEKLEGELATATAKSDGFASALKSEGAALDAARQKAEADANAHKHLAAAQMNVAQASKTAAVAEGKAAAAHAKAAEAAAHTARGTRDIGQLGGALRQLPGPLGSVGGGLLDMAENGQNLGKALGPMGGMLAMVAVGVFALGAALVKAAIDAIKFAITMADAARSVNVANEALEVGRANLVGISSTIEDVHHSTRVARDTLHGFAKQLNTAGIKAEDMADALKAMALAEAAGHGDDIGKMVEDLKAGKTTAAQLAAEMDKVYGPIVQKKALSLDAITERFHENLQGLFSGLRMEKFLEMLQGAADLFDKNTASGRAMKWVLETIFQPMIDGAAEAWPRVERVFIQFLIAIIKLHNALKPMRDAINKAFGGKEGDNPFFSMLRAGAATVDTIKEALSGVGSAASALLGIIAMPFSLLGVGANEGMSALKAIDLTSIGSSMMSGLAAGITGGSSGVVAAMSKSVADAVKTAKDQLAIKSPSKVFAEIGGYTAEGFSEGIEDGSDATTSAMEEMVSPPEASAGGAGATGGGSRSITIGDIVVHTSSDNPEGIAAAVRRAVLEMLEGEAMELAGA